MKFFKKGFAFLLVFALLISSIGVGVFATPADDDIVGLYITRDNENVGQGKDVTYTLVFKALKQDNVNLNSAQIVVQFDKDKYTVSVPEILAEAKTNEIGTAEGEVSLFTTPSNGFIATNSGTLMMKLKFTVAANAEVATGVSPFTVTTAKPLDTDDVDVKTYIDTVPTINILAADKITGTETATVTDKTIGTDVKDILPKTVKVTSSEKNSAVVGTQVPVEWDTTDFNNKLLTEQTVTGTINVKDPITVAENLKATAKVTLKPIAATATELTAATGKVKEDTKNGITEAAIKESLGNTINVSKGEGTAKIEDTFTVTWDTVVGYTNDGKGYKDKDSITVKGNLTSPSKKGLFTVDDATKAVTGTVTVGPANIEGGSFELTDSTFVPNTKPAVKVTVPATEVAKLKLSTEAGGEAESNRQIVAKIGDNDTDVATDKFTDDEIKAARKDVEDANGDAEKIAALAPYTKTVTFSKSLSDLGYDTTDAKKAFTVSVTVGGTTLLAGKNEDGTVIETVGGTVVKPSSGGSSGSIGINKGNTTKTYAVTVVETKNGTATVSADKAAQGTTVTVKAEPAEGYKVKSVTAVKADGTNVPVDEKAYTFTMPASAVKVTVEFEEGKDEPSVDPTPAEDKFADVADDFWAAKDIYTLKDAGIIGGKSATEFDPEGDVTRAEFAKMVVGLFGYKATSDAVNFEDCKAEDWFTSYVAAGVEAGVIKGVSDTEFAPNATITREDACTILGRALNKVAQSNELKFTDADKVAEYAAPYVALLSELGYVNGYEDGSFAPTNNITRAEAAKIIAGIYNANKSAETVTDDKTETDANADAAVDEKVEEKVEEKTDEKAVDTIETEPEK